MSKQFIVDRYTTPGTPALDPVATAKVPVYDTEADLDADLANIPDGQLASWVEEGANLSVPVDEVKSGDMHAVTSNAVYESQKLGDIETISLPYTATQRCIVYLNGNPQSQSNAYAGFIVTDSNNNTVNITFSSTNGWQQGTSVMLEKGDTLTQDFLYNYSLTKQVRKIGA